MWEVAHTEGRQWPSFSQLSNSTQLRILTAPVTTLVSPSTTLDGTLTPHHIPGLFLSHLSPLQRYLSVSPTTATTGSTWLCIPNPFCSSLWVTPLSVLHSTAWSLPTNYESAPLHTLPCRVQSPCKPACAVH